MNTRNKRRKEGNSHISLVSIQQYLANGTYPNGSSNIEKRSVRKRAESFRIEDDVLYYIARPKRLDDEPIDPDPGANKANLRKTILTQRDQLALTSRLHVSSKGIHMGTERTLQALTAKYYWVGMSATVRKVLKSCPICLTNRSTTNVLQHSSSTSTTSPLEETIIVSIPTELVNDDDNGQDSMEVKVENETSKDATVVEDLKNIFIEIHEPESVDLYLDFDPTTAIAVDDAFQRDSELLDAKRFWERVEVQILATNSTEKKSFIILLMDSCSKWLEAQVLEEVNEHTISEFLMFIIARFGLMKQLVLLNNTTSQELFPTLDTISSNLNFFDVTILTEDENPFDQYWERVVKHVNRFTETYPDIWWRCLEYCLLPLRNSVNPRSDYSPTYLVTGREPIFPDVLFPSRLNSDSEVMLNETQLEEVTDQVMKAFMECIGPYVERAIQPQETPVSPSETELSVSGTRVRKSGRKVKKSHRLAEFDDKGNENVSHDHGYQKDEEFSTVPLKKRKHTSGEDPSLMKDSSAAAPHSKPKVERKKQAKDISKLLEHKCSCEHYAFDELDNDTYYTILKVYLATGICPDNCSTTQQEAIHKISEQYSLEDENLFFMDEKGKKFVVLSLRDRLKALQNAHVVLGDHLPKPRLLEQIENDQLIWKGLSYDADAYVKACPDCKHGGLRIRKKTKRMTKWRRDLTNDEDDEADSENETYPGDISKRSYSELINYLKRGIHPENLTRSELVIFKKKARNFKMMKGSLHYCPVSQPRASARKVLLSEKERISAISKFHGNHHLGHNEVLTELRKTCFWKSMVSDVDRFILSCCQPQPGSDVGFQDVDLKRRIKLFQQHFAGKDICEISSLPISAVDNPLKSAKDMNEETTEDVTPVTETEFDHENEEGQTGTKLNLAVEVHNLDTVSSDTQHYDEGTIVTEEMSHIKESDNQNQLTPEAIASSYHEEIAGYGQKCEAEDNEHVPEMDPDDKKWKPENEKQEEEGNVLTTKTSAAKSEPKKKRVKIRCEECNVIVRGENNFKEHMYRHTGVKPFSCPHCPKFFTSVKGVRMHLRRHTGQRPYLCNVCGRGFPRSASLQYHIKTHDKSGAPPIICDICNRSFTSEHRLKKHKRFKHPAQMPVFMCGQCGKHFTAKRSLKRHEETHQGIRKYKCQYCKRSFFRKEYLNYHLMSHYSEDPALAELHAKRKMKKRVASRTSQTVNPNQQILSIVSVDPELGQEQEVYGQLVEVSNTHEWAEVQSRIEDTHAVLDLNGSLHIPGGHQLEQGTTVVMVENQQNEEGNVEVRHIIMPNSQLQSHQQELQLQEPQEQPRANLMTLHAQDHTDQPQQIEVTLSDGQQHTLTLGSGEPIRIVDQGQETVQYQVECVPGESLTEADFNAIRMLAQTSMLQHNL